jgi:hypothetical protein
MLSQSYANILNLPIFGYGAKTSPFSTKTCPMFPLSRSIRNPFTPNHQSVLDQGYSDCLSMLELSVPVNLTPMLNFFKSLGVHQRKRLARRSKDVPDMKNTVDSFYVLYVLSTGIIDDVKDIMRCLTESDWMKLPL